MQIFFFSFDKLHLFFFLHFGQELNTKIRLKPLPRILTQLSWATLQMSSRLKAATADCVFELMEILCHFEMGFATRRNKIVFKFKFWRKCVSKNASLSINIKKNKI